jgi:hemoglobin/transferrin/lactoferrin receptor protein
VLSYSRTRVDVPTYEFQGTVIPGAPPIRVFEYARNAIGETRTLSAKGENKFSFDRGTIVAGVEVRRDKADIDYDPVGTEPPSHEKSTVAGVFAQARLEPIERARLSFGGRGDYQWFRGVNDNDGAHKNHGGLSANVSGEYDLIPDLLTAKVGYSHVWAGVQLAENFVMNNAWVYRNALGELKATKSDNVTAGLLARHNGFTLEGSVFGTNIDNARNAKFANNYFPPFDTPVPGASYAPDLKTRGFEIGVGYAWETGFVRGKYVSIDIDINGRRGDSDVGNYIATPVGDIFAVTAAHTFATWNVTVGGDFEYAPEYKRVGRDQTTGVRYPSYEAYTVFNAFAEWKPQTARFETTLRIDVKNLFDETYSSRATYGSEFGNVTPLFEPGRSVILSAAVRF